MSDEKWGTQSIKKLREERVVCMGQEHRKKQLVPEEKIPIVIQDASTKDCAAFGVHWYG